MKKSPNQDEDVHLNDAIELEAVDILMINSFQGEAVQKPCKIISLSSIVLQRSTSNTLFSKETKVAPQMQRKQKDLRDFDGFWNTVIYDVVCTIMNLEMVYPVRQQFQAVWYL